MECVKTFHCVLISVFFLVWAVPSSSCLYLLLMYVFFLVWVALTSSCLYLLLSPTTDYGICISQDDSIVTEFGFTGLPSG